MDNVYSLKQRLSRFKTTEKVAYTALFLSSISIGIGIGNHINNRTMARNLTQILEPLARKYMHDAFSEMASK